MVEHLVSIVKSMGVYCLAEGIECQEELQVCRQIGFEYAQGFALGRPMPASAWQEQPASGGQDPLADTTAGIFRSRSVPPAKSAKRTSATPATI